MKREIMNKGEVWLVRLFEAAGREEQGFRPAVIIADTTTTIAVVIPLTSQARALRFPFTIEVESSEKNGLVLPSVALVFHIRAIDKSHLARRLGIIEKKYLLSIEGALKKLFGL